MFHICEGANEASLWGSGFLSKNNSVKGGDLEEGECNSAVTPQSGHSLW